MMPGGTSRIRLSIAKAIVAYSAAVADLPLPLASPYDTALLAALDVEGKILRAVEALGPIAGRDVAVVGAGPRELAQLAELGGRVTEIAAATGNEDAPTAALADESADVVAARWTGYRAARSDDLADADRVLRPDGRLLVVHDYGRDDVSRLRGELPEYGWSRRDGPFLTSGFRIRVIHCFWTFPDLDAAREFLRGAFGAAGGALAETLKRPRLSYNVGVYHRTRGGDLAAPT
jgi:hypothetical protein